MYRVKQFVPFFANPVIALYQVDITFMLLANEQIYENLSFSIIDVTIKYVNFPKMEIENCDTIQI